ncbi:basic proline-rich protein-like [Lathamus discolor]|uniref:basic proline-rich protein-like n=1 Tax=Lathamus discolor TaxID=678569 RepID=UPI0032B72BFF
MQCGCTDPAGHPQTAGSATASSRTAACTARTRSLPRGTRGITRAHLPQPGFLKHAPAPPAQHGSRCQRPPRSRSCPSGGGTTTVHRPRLPPAPRGPTGPRCHRRRARPDAPSPTADGTCRDGAGMEPVRATLPSGAAPARLPHAVPLVPAGCAAPAAPSESVQLIRAAPSRAEPSRTEPSRAAPSRAEPSRAAPSRAEPHRAEPSRTEPSRTEPSRAEPSRAAPLRPGPPRAVPKCPGPARAQRPLCRYSEDGPRGPGPGMGPPARLGTEPGGGRGPGGAARCGSLLQTAPPGLGAAARCRPTRAAVGTGTQPGSAERLQSPVPTAAWARAGLEEPPPLRPLGHRCPNLPLTSGAGARKRNPQCWIEPSLSPSRRSSRGRSRAPETQAGLGRKGLTLIQSQSPACCQGRPRPGECLERSMCASCFV